jgi:hypothetical protein
MKTLIGKVGVAAALIVALPLTSFAQNSGPRLSSGSRSTDRLTLLTGPDMLSPPHGAPQPSPRETFQNFNHNVNKVDAPAFRFVPALSANDKVTIGADREFVPPVVTPKATQRPSPESLRFDATFQPTTDSSTAKPQKAAPTR